MGTIQKLGMQVDAFAQAWQRDHYEAMQCWDLESALDFALSLYRYIRQLDAHWSELARVDHSRLNSPEANRIGELYRKWLEPCESFMQAITAQERAGFQLRQADEFRAAYANATMLTTLSPERLRGSTQRNGCGKTLAEVRDGLRH